MKYIMIIVSAAVLTLSADAVATDDTHVIALTLLGEARGEGYSGMYAVASTIAQRSINRKITPKQVCLQYKQFSCWNNTNKEVKDLKYLFDENKDNTKMAMFLAANIKGLNKSWIGNADHYHNNKIKRPSWSYKYTVVKGKKIKTPIKPTKIIGNHIFYKLK